MYTGPDFNPDAFTHIYIQIIYSAIVRKIKKKQMTFYQGTIKSESVYYN